MAVYTHFGGMPALVKEIVAEGFKRLDEHQAGVPHTDDPLADLLAAGARLPCTTRWRTRTCTS